MAAAIIAQKREKRQKSRSQQDKISRKSDLAVKPDYGSDSDSDKDDMEKELERLVFGDKDGFRNALQDREEDEEYVNGEPKNNLAALEDTSLFFVDTTGDLDVPTVSQVEQSADDGTLRSTLPAAWEDSDDERMVVSLATVPGMRKLRLNEGEDLVNGKEYTKRLRRQFELLNPKPEWALVSSGKHPKKRRRLSDEAESETNDSADDMGDSASSAPLSRLLQDSTALIRKSHGTGRRRKLRAEVLNIQRGGEVGGIQPSALTSLSFHPDLPLLLSSGPASTLYLHHIAPSPPAPSANPLLTSMHLKGRPLTTTAFHPTDSRIFIAGQRRHFHIWNLNTGRVEKITRVHGQQHEQRSMDRFKLSPDGKYMALLGTLSKGAGVVNILSAANLLWVSQAHVQGGGGIADFAWWGNSEGLCIAGKNGEVTEWEIDSNSIVARWQDEGAVGTTTLALGGQYEGRDSPIGNDRWVVIGSSSGIVNIYDRREWTAADGETNVPSQPKPVKTVDNLTTPTSNIAFSPDGQVVSISSKWARNAIRLIHLPSCTVYKNWPVQSSPLGRITGVAFCSGEKIGEDVHSLLAISNEQGKILLWEIR